MKAQISRDSYQENKTYSGVYQQQGRMLTDADWNEMVRILKTRVEKTLDGAVHSGSPRVGGILTINSISGKPPFPEIRREVKELKWGRVYVDGIWGEIRSKSDPRSDAVFSDLNQLLTQQRDFPSSPSVPDRPVPQDGLHYVVYVDLWERTVLALEDPGLTDSALHGADTCFRTETLAQVKVAPISKELAETGAELWQPPPQLANGKGDAELRLVDDGHIGPVTRESRRNALFRLEVHSVVEISNGVEVTLKWSWANGAIAHKNVDNLPRDAFDNAHVIECYSRDSECHQGWHATFNNWKPKTAELYLLTDLAAAKKVADTLPYIRGWDGAVILRRTGSAWSITAPELVPVSCEISVDGTNNRLLLSDKTAGARFSLSLGGSAFVAGDYWLVLTRDTESGVRAAVLSDEPSAKPRGIVHHSMVLGTLSVDQGNKKRFYVTAAQWRRLSFPSLTKLTLDRVLVEDASGNELGSIVELFDGHVNNRTQAHAASAIAYAGATGARNSSPPNYNAQADSVENALDFLLSEVNKRAGNVDLEDHLSNPTRAHSALAITYAGAEGEPDSSAPVCSAPPGSVARALDFLLAEINKRVATTELPSVTDKFVDAAGDTMTGPLKVIGSGEEGGIALSKFGVDMNYGGQGTRMRLSTSWGPSIEMWPSSDKFAGIRATTRSVDGEEGAAALELSGILVIQRGKPARGKVLVAVDDEGQAKWAAPDDAGEVLSWLDW